METLIDTTLLFAAMGILLWFPGRIVLRIFFGTQTTLSSPETLILSFAIGIGLVDFLMLGIGKAGLTLNTMTMLLGLCASLIILAIIAFVYKSLRGKASHQHDSQNNTGHDFTFSKKQGLLFVALIALTILIKVIYLTHAVLPTATDLGHHMYWSKLIAASGSLPFYSKQEIVTASDGTYQLTAPQPIADFIIGEHLPFAAVSIFTKLDFFSAFPVIFLFAVNILSLFALFALTLRFIRELDHPLFSKTVFSPHNVALIVLFFFGPLYTLASPQAKFVSGGVVGNTFGNFFIPVILLVYYRALKEKNAGFLALGFFLTFVLAYTHHLSTLILLFILIASALAYLIFHYDSLKDVLFSWWKILSAPAPIIIVIGAVLFFFAVAMPTYIETNAISTAIGTPTKATRTGLTFLQITFSSGEARVALGLAGIALLLALVPKRRYATAFLAGWSVILLVMTYAPQWLFIDIPSNRIGTYLSFPLGILAALSIVALFASSKTTFTTLRIPSILFLILGFTFFVFSSGSGSYDNSQTLLPKNKAFSVLQTFTASRYLAEHSTQNDVVLKDHNYIVADAWMKLFFLRDYAYPLSRGFFKRYEDNPHREQCTLLMISVPNTTKGEKCYTDLGVDLVVVNPHFDATQFEKSQKFSRIYASDDIHIYKRK